MIILDTNVLSELMRPSPSERVVQWIEQHPPGDLATTAITEAEILFGIALLPPGRRRNDLAHAAGAMFAEDFEGRVFSVDSEAARHGTRAVRAPELQVVAPEVSESVGLVQMSES